MKNLTKRLRNLIKSPKKRLKVSLHSGRIISIKDTELDPNYKFAHAVTPTETGQCPVEGCTQYHGPIA